MKKLFIGMLMLASINSHAGFYCKGSAFDAYLYNVSNQEVMSFSSSNEIKECQEYLDLNINF